MTEIGKKLKELRKEAKESQTTVATALQTTQSYYAQYERGERSMPAERLRELCIHYGVSADYILGLPKGLEWPK